MTQQRDLEGPSQEAGQEEEHPEQARHKRGVGRGRSSSSPSTEACAARDGAASTGEKHKAGNKRKAPSNTARRGGKKGRFIDESEEATSAVDSPRAQHSSTRGTRKHVRLTPDEHASASVAKYLAIVRIAKMQKKDKIELLEVVLLTETDLALKAMIEDCLTEDMDLEELSRILEEAECICSDDA